MYTCTRYGQQNYAYRPDRYNFVTQYIVQREDAHSRPQLKIEIEDGHEAP